MLVFYTGILTWEKERNPSTVLGAAPHEVSDAQVRIITLA